MKLRNDLPLLSIPMSEPTKRERQEAAIQAEMARTVQRLYSLSVMLLRSESAFEKYYEEATKLFAAEKSDDELIADVNEHLQRLENNTFLRAGALLTMYMALLWVVVEGWRKWKFSDARVDSLLASDFVGELKQYRHAIFHARDYNDRDLMQWSADQARVEWTRKLSAAFYSALLDWHANLRDHVIVHLLKPPNGRR